MVTWIIVAFVVIGLGLLAWRLLPSKVRQSDRLARHDPDAAARIEMQRAETNMRGRSGGGSLGGF